MAGREDPPLGPLAAKPDSSGGAKEGGLREVEQAIEAIRRSGRMRPRVLEVSPSIRVLGPVFQCGWCGSQTSSLVSLGEGWAAPMAVVCSICGRSGVRKGLKHRYLDWDDLYPYWMDNWHE